MFKRAKYNAYSKQGKTRCENNYSTICMGPSVEGAGPAFSVSFVRPPWSWKWIFN